MTDKDNHPTDPQIETSETSKDDSKIYGVQSNVGVKAKGKTKKRIKWIFLGLGLIVILGAAAIVLPLTLGKASKDAIIRVPKNATIETVHDSIAKYLGKDYAAKVEQSLKIFGFEERNRHGAYKIEKGMNALTAGRRLSRGGQTEMTLVITGVRTKNDLANLISSNFDITEEEMLNALNDRDFLDSLNTDPDKVIGFFLNNSYNFYWNVAPKDIIVKIRKEYRRFWNNERQSKAEALRMSPRTITILASIVDEETNDESEKGKVGRLYINRLNRDMKLESDPTVRYALNDFTRNRILNEDTKIESPYNTYRVKGLPPGPIRTADPRTIDAILNSEPSDYIFMCADSALNGRHKFSSDYSAHLKYAAEYREALDKKGIKR